MTIRKISPEDNAQVANIIRTVMPEFGASGKGFAIHDNEVEDMHSAYSRSRCTYFVCEEGGKLVGGGGVAPLEGGDADTCELKKMYFLPDGRGKSGDSWCWMNVWRPPKSGLPGATSKRSTP